MPLPLILGTNAVTGGYEVANSLRFNSGSSDYLNRTPSSASNRDLWSISAWVKRSKLGIYSTIYGVYTDANNQENFGFLNNDKFQWQLYQSGGVVGQLTTNRLFRDVGSWYHILGVYDSANGTAGNRMRLYINGVEETSFATDTNPSSGQDSLWNNNTLHMIGGGGGASGGDFFDGYISELVAVDGTALSPTDVGEFDSDSPTIWKPKDVSGLTFGTNGFYLDFEDSSALGNDAAGSNNFTVNNLTAIDQSTDTCTNNFATLNPIQAALSSATFSEGNLKSVTAGTSSANFGGGSSIGVSSGKWYFEAKATVGSGSSDRNVIGVTGELSTIAYNKSYYGSSSTVSYQSYNGKVIKNESDQYTGSLYATGDIIQIGLLFGTSNFTIEIILRNAENTITYGTSSPLTLMYNVSPLNWPSNSQFKLIAPVSNNEDYLNYKIDKKKHSLIDISFPFQVKSIDGFAMILNLKKMKQLDDFKNNKFFDENIFLYLENDDLCKRIIDNEEKIYVVPKSKINHLGASAVNKKYKDQIEISRNWHWIWSKFYFNKKHNGYLIAIINGLPTFLSSILKFSFYSLLNHKKKNIYFYRASGYLSALFGKKSYFRPKIKN